MNDQVPSLLLIASDLHTKLHLQRLLELCLFQIPSCDESQTGKIDGNLPYKFSENLNTLG